MVFIHSQENKRPIYIQQSTTWQTCHYVVHTKRFQTFSTPPICSQAYDQNRNPQQSSLNPILYAFREKIRRMKSLVHMVDIQVL
jgi:hypothetical protein